MKKLSSEQKAARVVAPRVSAARRQTAVAKATSKTVARSAVTGRYVAKSSSTKKAR